jgi:hypothetical protein
MATRSASVTCGSALFDNDRGRRLQALLKAAALKLTIFTCRTLAYRLLTIGDVYGSGRLSDVRRRYPGERDSHYEDMPELRG